MEKKKVLIFSTAYYPFVGGAEIAVKEITDILGRNFQFDLITARFDKKLPTFETIGKVNVYRVGFGRPLLDKLLLPFWGAIKAWKLQKENNYFCFWGIMATFGSGAGYICNIMRAIFRKKKIPIILTLQEGDSDNHLRYKWAGLINLSWKLALWNTDFMTAISNFLLSRAKNMGYDGDSALIPNGVNLKCFSKVFKPKEIEEVKVKLGKKPRDIFLVTSSRLVKKNAVDDIITALGYMPERVSLIIIGKGEEGPRLQEQARAFELCHRVKFLGYVPQEDIPKYFSACDIFVRPSRSEGFGNSFIEAMAARLPVIATPIGGIVDFVDDRETGIFCTPDSPKSIADAVRSIVDDQRLKEHIVNNALERVKSRYSWDFIAKEMKEKVFDKITSNE